MVGKYTIVPWIRNGINTFSQLKSSFFFAGFTLIRIFIKDMGRHYGWTTIFALCKGEVRFSTNSSRANGFSIWKVPGISQASCHDGFLYKPLQGEDGAEGTA